MHYKADHKRWDIEVTGRVIYSHHETEPVRLALVVEAYDDDFGFDEYFIANRGMGIELEDYVDDIVTVYGRMRILESALYITHRERAMRTSPSTPPTLPNQQTADHPPGSLRG